MPLHASFRLLGKTPLPIAVLVCVLALPALVGRIHSNAGAIRAQENRKMATLRSEEHTSELQSLSDLVCRLLLEKKNCSAGQ